LKNHQHSAPQGVYNTVKSFLLVRHLIPFIHFMRRTIHRFKISTKYLFNLVILCVIWKSTNSNIHEHVDYRQPQNIVHMKLNDFTEKWVNNAHQVDSPKLTMSNTLEVLSSDTVQASSPLLLTFMSSMLPKTSQQMGIII